MKELLLGNAVLPSEDNTIVDTWEKMADLPAARARHSSVEINGKIYIYGGFGSPPSGVLTIFDIATKTFTTGTNGLARWGHGVCKIGSAFYAYGGNDASGTILATFAKYDPGTNAWVGLTTGSQVRSRLGAVNYGEKFYSIGGLSASSTIANRTERYDPVSNLWDANGLVLSIAHAQGGYAQNGNLVYASGGFGSAPQQNFTEVNLATLATRSLVNLPVTRHSHVSGFAKKGVYLFGGSVGSGTNAKTARYDLGTGLWSELSTIPFTIGDWASICQVGKVFYIIGGASNAIWKYTP